jgi:uncharacterized protein (DUF2336 family)
VSAADLGCIVRRAERRWLLYPEQRPFGLGRLRARYSHARLADSLRISLRSFSKVGRPLLAQHDAMTAYPSLINEIEAAITQGSTERRTSLLRSISDLFIQSVESFSHQQIDLFDDVIIKLCEHIEVAARAELAHRLAPLDRSPPAVIKRLASDDAIVVAKPVLERSPQLQESDLVHLAETKSQEHLLAISKRKSLSGNLTDVLVRRGDRDVARSVAENKGASFSATGLDTLIARSSGDAILAECLAIRKDLTIAQMQRLIAVASEIVRGKLSEENFARQNVRDAVAKVSGRMRPENPAQAKKRMVDALFAAGKLDEKVLQDAAANGNFADLVVALSMLSSMSANTIEALLADHHTDIILVLAKASELSWESAKSLLTMHPACGGGGGEISHLHLNEAFENYKTLQVATAQRILRFYRARRAVMTEQVTIRQPQ